MFKCSVATLIPLLLTVIGQAGVNRTVPKVNPPKSGLQFSAQPTAHEISRARVFEAPLVPIGGEPGAEENTALAAALVGYAKREGPDDFSSLTAFLEQHPNSPWRAALRTGLGAEYYNTAHYSLALEAWRMALAQHNGVTNAEGMVVLARATESLASLLARLGRMTELETLLKLFGDHGSEKINQARDALWMMRHQPEISFRCGPLALQSILRSDPQRLESCSTNALIQLFNSASTTKGFSLSQVAELSKRVGLNFQMAFRPISESVNSKLTNSLAHSAANFVVPSVVHWKVGHFAAMVRQEGDRYLLEDPTFGNTVWATKQALEAETSGYFLIPPGELPRGWRFVDTLEGETIWGKGVTGGNDGDVYTPGDLQTGQTCMAGSDFGMAVASVHLMTVNLSVHDTPLAYTPPVGPPVRFTFRYNSRDSYATEQTFGGQYWNGFNNTNYYNSATNMPPVSFFLLPSTRMTHDWISYLVHSPQNPLADVKYVVGGGGARTFTRFSTNTQTFALQQYDQTVLKRTSPNSYEMVAPDGSKRIFGQSDGSIGSSSRVYLSQIADRFGNTLTFTYDQDMRPVAVTDAIGQVTTLTYGDGTNMPTYLLTRVTDPFGRSATFDYEKDTVHFLLGILVTIVNTNTVVTDPIVANYEFYKLTKIADVFGLASQFQVSDAGGVTAVVTPYGTNSFHTGGGGTNNTRFAEIIYPDGSKERVEYNQSQIPGIPGSDPAVPAGMTTFNAFLFARNTYYWSRTASATSYGDHSKARIYHWLHTDGGSTAAGILECTKQPLENRVWYNYPDQNTQGGSAWVGSSDQPTKVGRVLEDGTTQLYTMAYNSFGKLTSSIDPLGRTFSLIYATNGIDLLEIRQTRAANDELLARVSYNTQHLPVTVVDAAGQTNWFTYNARGQLLTATDQKGQTTTFVYDADGHLGIVNGPLPDSADRILLNYDIYSRVRAITDSSGYRVDLEYDDMDRLTRMTYPDGTFVVYTYDRLDLATVRDRAGREALFECDSMRHLKKTTDPLGRVMLTDWCRCGQIKSLTDPMGRTTTWLTDVQGRVTGKQHADGSQVIYQYETASGRLKQVIDEKQQVTQYAWNRDDTLKSIAYFSAMIPTPGVSYTYDPDYERVTSMTDGTGTTRYTYNPVTSTPTLGAGALASVDGPLPNDTITYAYDELSRPIHHAINGVGTTRTFDETGRMVGLTNALGSFVYGFDGNTARLLSKFLPNGQAMTFGYGGTNQDMMLQRITHTFGATPISEFLYSHDVPAQRIATWSQQAGAAPPSIHSFEYDAVNQLLTATVTNEGNLVGTFAYTYDPAANRLTEQVGASNFTATYNALNEVSTTTVPGAARTNEWDARDRLAAVTVGNQRTEFTYDGVGRRVAIRGLVNGSEISYRRFLWCGGEICEERDAAGAVIKRFFSNGMKIESGPAAGSYFYTRDHLGSIREVVDGSGNVRARYSYDPYGRRIRLSGDLDADFGFAGMFWCAEAELCLTHFRAYDPQLGRWLSRDPLPSAEIRQGPNLYSYVFNDPINLLDPEGLCTGSTLCKCFQHPQVAAACAATPKVAQEVAEKGPGAIRTVQGWAPAAQNTLQCAQSALPAAESEIPALEANVPGIVQTLQTTGGSLPNIVRAAKPSATELLEQMGIRVNSIIQESEFFQMSIDWQKSQWLVRTYNALREFRGPLDPLEDQQFINELEYFARMLFGQ
jgi:RHS repeat-associated protein